MTLLFITQKLHDQDAFTVLWIRAFLKRGYDVRVICLENRLPEEAHPDFTVHSLGKERGYGKMRQILRFWKLIATLHYDRVFIHMSPVWYTLGWKWWWITRTPCYLWYTHYKMQSGVWLFVLFGNRLFCATEQSLPQYRDFPKKIVTGHGIDLACWKQRPNVCGDPRRLLAVHRLSRSKRLELTLRAMTLLPDRVLDVYGVDAESDYADEMRTLMEALSLQNRVTFHGTVPMLQLPVIYASHRMLLNMASETIDKTMLEAMTCGCYPVTTKRNAEAIGLRPRNDGRRADVPAAPEHDTPEAIAAFVRQCEHALPMSADAMHAIVREHHSLEKLIEKMDGYIRNGT